MNRACVLVVDDEPQMHRFLKPALEAAGYDTLRADTGEEGLRMAATRAPDAVLLDLGLPDIDGQDALLRLRSFSAVPVVVVSARDREAEKIRALDAGADDYVEKPFGVGELLARLRAALRHARTRDSVPEVWQANGVIVDLVRHSVIAGGAPVQLTRREYDLLALLVRNSGRVMTHRQLLVAVWGPAHIEDVQYLRVYIGQIRQKLGSSGGRLVTTEPGVGYRLLESEQST